MSPVVAMQVALLLPLVTAFLVVGTGKWPNLRDGISTVSTFLTLGVVASLLPAVRAGERPSFVLLEVLDGVHLSFTLEPLGMLYALVASGLWIPTSLYAIGYLRGHHEINQTRFFACFALAIFAALGIAFSGNLFTLFLFYEVLTFSTWPLVTHHGTLKAIKAGRIYMGILVFTSVCFLLFGIIWTWQLTGTVDFVQGGFMRGKVPTELLPILLGLFAFGAGKAALMPFHRWLPNAMVAPTPVSALLHAVAVVKAGVFTILKVVVYVFGIDLLAETGASEWLMAVAAFTVIASSLKALGLNNLKARLAYSTISQLGYIVLAASFATGSGIIAGGSHIAGHAMGKITLFFVAGAVYVAAHKTEISDMRGIGRRMPLTFLAFFMGSLAIIGIPPFGPFLTKPGLFLAISESQPAWFFVYVVSTLLAIGYLMPVVVTAFLDPKPDDDDHASHGPQEADEHESYGAREYGDLRDVVDAHAHAHHEPDVGTWGWSFALERQHPLLVIPPVLTALGCIGLFFWGDEVIALLAPIVVGGAS